jgi:hypothetical protein
MGADIDAGGLGEEGARLFHEAVTHAAYSPGSPTSWQGSPGRSARPSGTHSASRDVLPAPCEPIARFWRQSGARMCPVRARPCAVT